MDHNLPWPTTVRSKHNVRGYVVVPESWTRSGLDMDLDPRRMVPDKFIYGTVNMKTIFAYLLLVLFPSSALAILGGASDLLNEFYALPECGVSCILPTLAGLNCSFTNITLAAPCLCGNIPAEKFISECVLANCTYQELVKVEKLQYNLCYNETKPSRRANIYAVTITLTILTVVMVVLRCWSRYTVSKQFWWDDWFVIFSTTCFLGLQANNLWGVGMGFGVHVWNVNPDLNKKLYQFEWIYEILYVVVTTTTKTSVLLLYYRIFPQTWLHKTIWCACGFMALHFVVFLSLVTFQCNPVSLVFDKTREGKCINFYIVILWGAIITIIEDLAAICLPIPSLLKLKLRTSKKISVILVMSVGLIAVIASLVRLKYVVVFKYGIDINWDDYDIAVMSTIELSLSIMCVCFPAIKLLLNAEFPKYFGHDKRPINARRSLRLSGGESPESRSSSLLRILRRKISIILGQSKASTSTTSRPQPWVDEESAPVTEVASMPNLGGRDQSRENLSRENSDVDMEINGVYEKESTL